MNSPKGTLIIISASQQLSIACRLSRWSRGRSLAFQILGSRPEDLRKTVRDGLVRPEADLGDAIVAAAHDQRAQLLTELRRQLGVLNGLQRAILKRMVRLGDGTQPFSRGSIGFRRREINAGRRCCPAAGDARN
jgi:hypothetical protein